VQVVADADFIVDNRRRIEKLVIIPAARIAFVLQKFARNRLSQIQKTLAVKKTEACVDLAQMSVVGIDDKFAFDSHKTIFIMIV